LRTLTNLTSNPLPGGPTPKEDRIKAMEDSVDWLRKNTPEMDVDEPTLEALSNLTGLPPPKKRTPEEKKKFVEDSMDWLRKNEPDLEDVDDSTVEEVTNLAGVPMPPGVIPKVAKKKPVEDAIDWLRKNGPPLKSR
jgi:hypothetical protein